jgi:pimeloyl-ACP methyl ester carboxylesterase
VDGQGHRLSARRSAAASATLFILLAAVAQSQIARDTRAAECDALRRLSLPAASITAADPIAPGTLTLPDGTVEVVPGFCRVHGEARPTPESRIHFELWMPASAWNGRYYQLGSGGFGGNIHLPALAAELRRSNAVAATDTGHQASPFDASWALGHPERIVDYGHRSLKSTADAASALIEAYYAKPPRYRYFVGCSNGGRQALMAAQRYPEDWDGILAGAPAYDWTGQLSAFAAMQQALRRDPANWIPPGKLPAIERAALASCTRSARLARGVPADPRACPFDPAVLICDGVETHECLTERQAAMLALIQASPFGFEVTAATSEERWASWILDDQPRDESHLTFAEQFFRHMVFDDPDWRIEAFDAARDPVLARGRRVADETLSRALDATDPDLSRFEAGGGKLLMYAGWADALISPRAVVAYHARVAERMGANRVSRFLRLFMVPGMGHCQGGEAAHAFGQAPVAPALREDALHDVRAALEAWVERGLAVKRLVAVKYVGDDPARGVAITATLRPLDASRSQ